MEGFYFRREIQREALLMMGYWAELHEMWEWPWEGGQAKQEEVQTLKGRQAWKTLGI